MGVWIVVYRGWGLGGSVLEVWGWGSGVLGMGVGVVVYWGGSWSGGVSVVGDGVSRWV